MILGFTPFTFFHIAISLLGIASGCVVVLGMIRNHVRENWTLVFLATTVATSATGFFFPFAQLLPSHIIGIVSLVVLAVAIVARYFRRLAGPWRWLYAVAAVAALYCNVFVLIVQAFRRVPLLYDLAPTQAEAPFAIVQLAVLLVFVRLGERAVRGFRVTM